MDKISLFLDSGAHSLYTKQVIDKQHQSGYDFYDTDEFWEYVDNYAKFVKEHSKYIDVYVNVDVIFDPERSLVVQKYLEEKHGLSPLPVVHYGADPKWLKLCLEKYEYIGLGGLGQEVDARQYVGWADQMWDIICDTPDRLPKCKVHGFAMTALRFMLRYPWYSVDSTSWVMTSRMGSIYMPRYRNGEWVYDEDSWKVTVSSRSPSRSDDGKHIDTFPKNAQEHIFEYLDMKGYKLGKSEFKTASSKKYKLEENEKWFGKELPDGTREVEAVIEDGLCNNYKLRDEVNIIYFLDLEKSMPEWPWPFKAKGIKKFQM